MGAVGTSTTITHVQVMMMIQGVGGGGGGGGGSRGGNLSKFMELRWVSSKSSSKNRKTSIREFGSLKSKAPSSMIPLYISTNPSDINLEDLRELYGRCNHSCHRFPNVDPDSGRVQEVIDMDKLRTSVSHSAALVSVFCKPQHVDAVAPVASDASNQNHKQEKQVKGFVGELLENVMPVVTPSNGQLVGFGRAVSDFGLTASIYDVMVLPSLQGMGIGKMIVKRIVRMLTSREIYDIAALCSDKERLFFKACGFGDDTLGSTTMMYTRSVSGFEGDQMVSRAGRKVLFVPPLRRLFASLKTTKS